jgi:hypothetical protein
MSEIHRPAPVYLVKRTKYEASHRIEKIEAAFHHRINLNCFFFTPFYVGSNDYQMTTYKD